MKFQKKEKSEAGGNYLKIKDGESVKGVFRGEIHEFRIKWENNKSIEIPETDPTRMNRFRLNFIVYEGSKFIAKTWEFGITVYDQLASIHSEYDLQKTKVKITRQGTGTDTAYHVLPLLKEPIAGPVLAAIEAVPLNILNAKKSEGRPPPDFPEDFGDPPPEEDHDQLPF